MASPENPGEAMINFARELWPLNRSLSGEGLRKTLKALAAQIPEFKIRSIASGSQVFDWTVPKEWEVSEAYLISPSGERFCDFKENNLHLVGYSTSFEGDIELQELQNHLHSLESQPNAIPYVTSYYKEAWGFCLSQSDRDNLEPGKYRAVVKSRLFDGVLNYGELFIPGQSVREIFFSTYICHPSMANNELSGPVLAIELAKWLSKRENYYSFRFVFIPETIGSLIYMSRNLEQMKREILAGYVLTCVGDDRAFSYLPSRKGNSVADKAALQVLQEQKIDFIHYSWLDRGSDERQYCSPGADLPFCSVMRSKYGEYPEYHTSLDTIGDVVTQRGLEGSFDFYSKLIERLESQRFPKSVHVGEPQLGRRGLWPNLSMKGVYKDVANHINLLSLSDGHSSLQEIGESLGKDETLISEIALQYEKLGLLEM